MVKPFLYVSFMENPVELAPDYYLDNFNKLTQHTVDWYSDFLTEQEQQWLTTFSALSHDAQCLLVRLFSRKGHWFRSDKLAYQEIGDISATLKELNQHGLIALNSTISNRQLAEMLLTKVELCSLFSVSNRSLRKEQLVNELTESAFNNFEQIHFEVIELLNPHIIDLLLTLFFANTHQDLSQFVLDDLGLHKFEAYQLSKTRRFFTSRQQVSQLLTLTDIHRRYLDSDKKNGDQLIELLEQIPTDIEHAYVDRRRQHLINDIARDLERLGLYQESIQWFESTQLPPARERLARIYDKLDDTNKMSDNVTEMLSHPIDLAEYEVAVKLEQRLKRKLRSRVPRQIKPKLQEYHLELDLSAQRVELAVKAHFESQGYQVFYSENTLLNGLFGLAFWDVVFAPVEGAFINQYQHRPLDLYHSDFKQKRIQAINDVFDSIATDGLTSLIDTYRRKWGTSNPFVQWSYLSEELLMAAITHFPASLITELFKVMLTDLKLYRNGMPDLILFKDGQYQWVEVKGPGDKLQDNQWRWIDRFIELDVNFHVCYVKALN